MHKIDEIAPDVFRISTFLRDFDLQFAQFLVRDEEPLLFHTGMNALFPVVHKAVSELIDPETLRWIGFSHFEADECGSLPQWQKVAPDVTAVCSLVGKMVSVDDFTGSEANGMNDGDVIETGKYRFRFVRTPHVPHCWEAGMLFEENNRTLFSSDVLHQNGDSDAVTEDSGVVGICKDTLEAMQESPLADYLPYTKKTDGILRSLAALEPKTVATMHGAVYSGDGAKVINDYADMLRDFNA
ncbi:MAG: MBL fold metallo-hydrolase [Acidobacteria bacterium]|nr:MAG: MBL fold metallo-hydrolase [Acidobacteriota bacterium]REJ99240.1 MAG: MBL fold metallo-hydrolase [Acidobacteriota bacterium]REK16039.1 MAG: MBL fold metallo-hydrolase [Acidobacteriota bacterium]REK43720.1 MAG: MBL fold metallo-hydrolase [Acidobacteriota bacterium]